MYIKSYKIFEENKADELSQFIEAILDATESWQSFSNIVNKDPDKEFAEFLENMNNLGWTWDKIVTTFNKYRDQILNPPMIAFSYPDITTMNGMIDHLLYKLTNGNIVLGGIDMHGGGEELIKYAYGYHKSEYGIMYIEQIYGKGNVKKFLQDMAEKFLIYMMEDNAGNEVNSFISELGFDLSTDFDAIEEFIQTDAGIIIEEIPGGFKSIIDKREFIDEFESFARSLLRKSGGDRLKKFRSVFNKYGEYEFFERLISTSDDKFNFLGWTSGDFKDFDDRIEFYWN